MRSVQQREDGPEDERLDCILRSVLESTSKTHFGGGDTSSVESDDIEYEVYIKLKKYTSSLTFKFKRAREIVMTCPKITF